MKIDAATLGRWVFALERAYRDTEDSDVGDVLREVREAWLRAEREEAK